VTFERLLNLFLWEKMQLGGQLHRGCSRIEIKTMKQPIIKHLLIGPFAVFSYIVACPQTREGVIIDPAGENEKILAALKEEGVQVRYILNMHGHADHVLGNEALKLAVSAPTCMHEADKVIKTIKI
jgi:glyoxylase-like metal-dependent hydrolase (beta-lactamase superfamily II)